LLVGLLLASSIGTLPGCASSGAGRGAKTEALESGAPPRSEAPPAVAIPEIAPSETLESGWVEPEAGRIDREWGVEIVGLYLSAGGYMLDFRYRVIDPEKARPILDHRVKPYLIHAESDAKLVVPSSPKVGALRQTNRSGEPIAGRVYFAFFANPGSFVKAGDRVHVVIGDYRAENLTVE